MASLWPPPIPTASLLKKTATASTDPDVTQTALLSSDPKSPWWSPLFRTIIRQPGSDRTAGYLSMSTEMKKGAAEEGSKEEERKSIKGIRMKRSLLTAEKARVLRREMRATETWHDAMYHSAIASRLASPDDP